MMRGGWSFVLMFAWGVVAMLAALGHAYAQGSGEKAATPPQTVDEGKSGNLLRSVVGGLSVHVNGAYQPTVRRYDRSRTFQAYGELAQFLSREEFGGRDHVDAGGAFRIWRRLELGASYTQVSRSGTAVVTGTVPHPIDAGRDRTAPERTVTLPHRQRATHVYAAWRFRLRDAWSVSLSAGPTYFQSAAGDRRQPDAQRGRRAAVLRGGLAGRHGGAHPQRRRVQCRRRLHGHAHARRFRAQAWRRLLRPCHIGFHRDSVQRRHAVHLLRRRRADRRRVARAVLTFSRHRAP